MDPPALFASWVAKRDAGGSNRSSVISYDSAELTAAFFSGDGSLNGGYDKLDVLQAMLIEFSESIFAFRNLVADF